EIEVSQQQNNQKHLGSWKETRVLTDHHGNKLLDTSQVPHSGDLRSRFSIRLFSLLIFRAGPDDSGIYICGSTHKDFFYGYDLDIQEAHMLSFTPRVERRLNEDTSDIPSVEQQGPRSCPLNLGVRTLHQQR
ncbi:Ig-like V-type domain-containing protein FAM187A, partial [Scomber scombrus]